MINVFRLNFLKMLLKYPNIGNFKGLYINYKLIKKRTCGGNSNHRLLIHDSLDFSIPI